jgi:hypothetical protein
MKGLANDDWLVADTTTISILGRMHTSESNPLFFGAIQLIDHLTNS